MSNALYFPNIALPSATWVNPSLLFFDKIGVIAPDGRPELFDQRMHELIDLGLACAVAPRDNWDYEKDLVFLSHISGIASHKRSFLKIERIHVGKLFRTRLTESLIAAGLLRRVDFQWFEGPDWVTSRIMMYIAMQLAWNADTPFSLVTDERAAARTMGGDRVAKIDSRRIRAVARLLPVPPDAQPIDIDRFRRHHLRELHLFREYVNGLITRDAFTPDGDERFDNRLREAERLRDYLKAEMEHFNWSAGGPSFFITALGVIAPLLEHSPYSLATGLIGLFFGGAQQMREFSRRRSAIESPLAYATHVVGNWKPTAERTLW